MIQDNKLITILTPTYNRADRLQLLFNSLKRQKNYNFEWMIIDDGSTDNTAQRVKGFQNSTSCNFKIRYFFKENEGKHTAINFAMDLINTPLTLIIDSDDQLVPGGISLIEHYWKKYRSIGINDMVFEHLFNNGKAMVIIKQSEVLERRALYPVKYKALGDYADVFVTAEFIRSKFPVFKGEKFLSEGHLYYSLSNKNAVFIDKPLTIGDYQSDGMTKNIRKNQIMSYKGTMYTATLFMDSMYPLWFRLKNGILYDYIAIKGACSLKKALRKSKYPMLTFAMFLPALVYSLLKR